MECVSCGALNEGKAKFCKKCGNPLDSSTEGASAGACSGKGAGEEKRTSENQGQSLAVPRLSFNHKRDCGLKAGQLEIHGKVISYAGMLLSIDNIEKVTTYVPQPPFPKLALLVFLAGIVALFTMLPAGIVLLLAAIAWIGWWLYKRSMAPKGVALFMVSGSCMIIHFADHDLASKMMDVLEAAISNENVELCLELPPDSSVEELGSSGGGLARIFGR